MVNWGCQAYVPVVNATTPKAHHHPLEPHASRIIIANTLVVTAVLYGMPQCTNPRLSNNHLIMGLPLLRLHTQPQIDEA
jgi:hypothetical protein